MTWVKGVPPKMLKDRFGAYSSKGGRVGWHGEMDRCWIDNEKDICVCSRLIRTRLGKVEHVTISRGTGIVDDALAMVWCENFGEEKDG